MHIPALNRKSTGIIINGNSCRTAGISLKMMKTGLVTKEENPDALNEMIHKGWRC